MLANEYLLQSQMDLIERQSKLIKDLEDQLKSKDEIINMLKRINVLDEQLHQLKINEILTPSMN